VAEVAWPHLEKKEGVSAKDPACQEQQCSSLCGSSHIIKNIKESIRLPLKYYFILMDSEEAFGFWETLSGNLPKEAVDAPSLEAFKARMDVALGSLVWWLATLHAGGGL